MKQEEPKQETLEEVAERIMSDCYGYKDYKGFYDFGFKKGFDFSQQQNNNLYSEEEVLKLLHNYRNNFELYRNIQVLPNDFFEWFNQNKKK